MSHYHHLTTNERESILKYLLEGNSIRSISRMLGRSPSTISRELRRNASETGYWPSKAAQRYQEQRKKCRRSKILSLPARRSFLREKIKDEQWSPEQIACWLKGRLDGFLISTCTIYRAINNGMMEVRKLSHKEKGFKRYLRHKGKPRHSSSQAETRGKIRISHTLDERPAGANDRSEFGHMELDTVHGRRGGACLLTLVDRRSRFLIVVKLPKCSADCVRDALLAVIRSLPAGFVKSFTPDRGKEFAKHAEVTAATGVEFYFPPPHAPWLRGTNENTNGLLREYFPKKKSLDSLTDDALQTIARKINNRPRKVLHWASPAEAFEKQVLHLT